MTLRLCIVNVMRAIEISEIEEETLWMNSISKNPAFDFLNEPEEDVYSQRDGEQLGGN